ncbi:hypothetical protein [Phormidium nigroviride]
MGTAKVSSKIIKSKNNSFVEEGRRKKEEGRRKKEEGRRKKNLVI